MGAEPKVRVSCVAPKQWCVINPDRIDDYEGIAAYIDLRTDSVDFSNYYFCQRHKKALSVGAPADRVRQTCSDIKFVIEHELTDNKDV